VVVGQAGLLLRTMVGNIPLGSPIGSSRPPPQQRADRVARVVADSMVLRHHLGARSAWMTLGGNRRMKFGRRSAAMMWIVGDQGTGTWVPKTVADTVGNPTGPGGTVVTGGLDGLDAHPGPSSSIPTTTFGYSPKTAC
jgi:hypothetical protein